MYNNKLDNHIILKIILSASRRQDQIQNELKNTFVCFYIGQQSKNLQLIQRYQSNHLTMLNLTEDAVAKLMQVEKGKNQNFVVDVYKILKKDGNYRTFRLTDGKAKLKGIIQVKDPTKDLEALLNKQKKQTLRIIITSHITYLHQGKPTCIEIIDFKMPNQPQPIQKIHLQALNKQRKIVTKLEQKQQRKITAFLKKECIETNHSKPAEKMMKQQYEEQTKQCEHEINIKGYEKISDLYESFHGWELLARVIDISYRVFTNKSGKITKILSVQLIDRVGSMITGNFFGDNAQNRQNAIQKGKIYRISRGKVVEDNYTNKTNPKCSKYSIIFGKDTEFIQMKENAQIPNVSSNWLRLSEISSLQPSEQTYNFVGVLIEIDDEVTIEKENRNITFQKFKIGDPITDIIYECTIWSRQFKIDQNLLGKSIIIKNFKIHVYRGQTNLSSTFKSDLEYHNAFFSFDNNLEHFKLLDQDISIKTLNELSQDLSQDTASPLRTNIEVSVSAMYFNQKWYYEACPKCKRSCSSFSKCVACDLEVSQPIKRYNIQVELADCTGSIKATAFDQSAAIILKNADIQSLSKMDIKDLIELGETYCFQQYRMQISSKKDQFARYNHRIIGKPTPLNFAYSAARNLKEINLFLGKMKMID